MNKEKTNVTYFKLEDPKKHLCMTLLRSAVLSLALLLPSILGPQDISSRPKDVINLYEMNIFQFTLTLECIFRRNIIKYYATIFVMVENILLSFAILFNTKYGGYYLPKICGLIISTSIIFETFLFCSFTIKNKFNLWLDIFKDIGGKESIQEAFYYRMILNTLKPLNLFYLGIFASRFVKNITEFDFSLKLIKLTLILLSVGILIFISVCGNDEILLQRNVALVLILLKIMFILLDAVLMYFKNVNLSSERVFTFLIYFVNDISVTSFTLYILVMDTLYFGSNLKARMNTKEYIQINMSE